MKNLLQLSAYFFYLLIVFTFFPIIELDATDLPLTVTVNTQEKKSFISPDFQGLSYEEPTLEARSGFPNYFDPKNTSLVNLMKTLGIKNLRFGGTTLDEKNYSISHADIDNLFAFAQAIDAKVIYGLRLKKDPTEDKLTFYQTTAQDVNYIMSQYAGQMDCFCLGNEPNVFYSNYSKFKPDWMEFTQSINQVSPEAKFCGPSAWNSTEKSWLLPFASDFGKQPNVVFITEHIYQSQAPKFRLPRGVVDPKKEADLEAKARQELLAKTDYGSYYNKFAPELEPNGEKYRIEETNSFSGGGVPNASDTYSASLWGLNYEFWWASHDALGINFHTGVHDSGSSSFFNYSVFSSTETDQIPWGLSYAMLAFKIMSQGQNVEAQMSKGPAKINLTAYAVSGSDGCLYLTLINEEFGPTGPGARVTIATPGYPISQVQTMALVQSNSDLAFAPEKSTQGSITLGNSTIDSQGLWSGDWSVPAAAEATDHLQVTVPQASALLVKITPAHT